mmetsp:Transcript_11849/g.19295  ORF Transcript_11849/g.19295 Transcript_11849/m.19295 type:complete len:303 (-) Transcript_11849:1075-1983(-)
MVPASSCCSADSVTGPGCTHTVSGGSVAARAASNRSCCSCRAAVSRRKATGSLSLSATLFLRPSLLGESGSASAKPRSPRFRPPRPPSPAPSSTDSSDSPCLRASWRRSSAVGSYGGSVTNSLVCSSTPSACSSPHLILRRAALWAVSACMSLASPGLRSPVENGTITCRSSTAERRRPLRCSTFLFGDLSPASSVAGGCVTALVDGLGDPTAGLSTLSALGVIVLAEPPPRLLPLLRLFSTSPVLDFLLLGLSPPSLPLLPLRLLPLPRGLFLGCPALPAGVVFALTATSDKRCMGILSPS